MSLSQMHKTAVGLHNKFCLLKDHDQFVLLAFKQCVQLSSPRSFEVQRVLLSATP